MITKEFKWLHLTDIHVGQHSMNWLWPNLKRIFISDLERIYKDIGGFDTLIFSGDLTQRGAVDEYDTLNSLLGELYESFDKWGGKPLFFPVPGNHDLVRPDMEVPESILIKRWWEESNVRTKFWQDGSNRYRSHLEKTFENYTNWLSGLSEKGIQIPEMVAGLLPGDRSAKLQFGGLSVGLVGLNSTFLQIDGEDFEAKLALDVRQLLSVTSDDPGKWCSDNDINFLITHHPPDWLEPRSRELFLQEISPPGRFTAHFYGHKHKARNTTLSLDGGPSRKSVQGSSIFGLEYFGNNRTKRVHGYSAGVIAVGESSADWKFWPRTEHVRDDGERRFIPDYNFALVAGKEYSNERLEISRKPTQGVSSSIKTTAHEVTVK